MKSYHRWVGPVTLALFAGCNNIDTALIIQNVGFPDSMTCGTTPDGSEILSDITYDSAQAETLYLQLRVQNTLQSGTIQFGSDEIPDNFMIPNSVSPVRMDIRWECDSNGFADDLGDLFVPQFSATEPFCISDDTRTFAGFDVIPASGGLIPPGELGVVEIRPITSQLGAAFNDVFQLAKKAQACCNDAPDGCDDATLQSKPMGANTPCGDLQASFDTIAGPGKLSAQSFADVQKFRPFLIYDHLEVPPKGGSLAPSYAMVLRGVLEGVTSDGSIVSSAEWRTVVHICANCTSAPVMGRNCTNL